jgi:acetyl esterase
MLIYPILDALMGTYSWVESDDPILTRDSMIVRWAAYIPVATEQQVPYISPVSARDLKGLPATFIFMGGRDPLRDTAELYTLNLKTAGVSVHVSRYANVIHSFFLMAGVLDAGKKCINEIAAALQETFKASP